MTIDLYESAGSIKNMRLYVVKEKMNLSRDDKWQIWAQKVNMEVSGGQDQYQGTKHVKLYNLVHCI